MDEKLNACPFCGYEHPTMVYSAYFGTYMVKCPNCQTFFGKDCTAGSDKSKERTVETWNSRAGARGKWVGVFCSICGEEAITEQSDCGGDVVYSKYCPHCGAEMIMEV